MLPRARFNQGNVLSRVSQTSSATRSCFRPQDRVSLFHCARSVGWISRRERTFSSAVFCNYTSCPSAVRLRLVASGLEPVRTFHSSLHRFDKESSDPDGGSKAERTLKLLREELQAQQAEASKEAQVAKVGTTDVAVKQSLPRRIWRKIVDECKHYYHGFKLLFFELRVSAGLLWQVVRGYPLTRRERKQLVRSVSDLFRLVPFSVFVIVPFMEFTLPIFLKLFPNMLPSTFQEQSKQDEKIRRQLKARLEMAKFLQASLEELSLQTKPKEDTAESKTQEFAQFLKQIRMEGGYISNQELLKFSKLFEDELTLENLTYGQLRALCSIVGIQPIGPSNVLRFQLMLKLRELKADDRIIKREGIEVLTIPELQAACRARGMRALGVSVDQLRKNLGEWLELSLNEKVPPSLLLLSRTLYLPEETDFQGRLKHIMSSLSDGVTNEAKLKLSELEGAKIDNKAKLELVRSIEEAIKREREELKREKAEEKKKKEADELKAKEAAAVGASAEPSDKAVLETAKPVKKEILEDIKAAIDAATPLSDDVVSRAQEVLIKAKAQKEAAEVHPEDLRELEQVLESVKGPLKDERDDLKELKEDVEDYKEDVAEVKSLVLMQGGKVEESKAARRLLARVDKIIGKTNKLLDKLHTQKDVIKADMQSVQTPEQVKENLISINELLLACRKLQKIPDDTKNQKILEVLNALDDNRDGAIDIDLALEVIELIGTENVKISSEKMAQITEMLKKEDKLEAEEEEEELKAKAQLNGGSNHQNDSRPSRSDTRQESEASSVGNATPTLKDNAKVVNR